HLGRDRVVRAGVERSGLVGSGVVRSGVERSGMVRSGVERQWLVRSGVVRPGLVGSPVVMTFRAQTAKAGTQMRPGPRLRVWSFTLALAVTAATLYVAVVAPSRHGSLGGWL